MSADGNWSRDQLSGRGAIVFRSLPGLTSYESARQLQLELLEKRAAGEIPDTVLFLEHEPVVTRGRGLQFTGVPRDRHMPMLPLPPGIAFAESERGGDLTYHGPGQLVIYPIVKLDGSGFGPHHDIAAFLRRFERVLIDVIEEMGREAGVELKGESRESATGVWFGDRKVASMGIAVRKWVTYHGLAVNVVNDLKPFHLISPCGFAPEVMTRVAELLPLESLLCKGIVGSEMPVGEGTRSHSAGVESFWRADLEARLARKMTEVVVNSCSAGGARGA